MHLTQTDLVELNTHSITPHPTHPHRPPIPPPPYPDIRHTPIFKSPSYLKAPLYPPVTPIPIPYTAPYTPPCTTISPTTPLFPITYQAAATLKTLYIHPPAFSTKMFYIHY